LRYHFVLNLFYQEVNPPVCLSYFPISYKFTIYTSVYQQIIHKYNLDNTRIAHFISFVKKDILCRCKDNGILIRFKTIRGLYTDESRYYDDERIRNKAAYWAALGAM